MIFFFLEFSNARDPSDFCNLTILPPAFKIFLNSDGKLEAEPIQQSHQSPAPSHSVHQRTFYNFLDQPSTSSGVRLDIDLNKPPSEGEGN